VLQENFSKAINLLKEALQLFETHNDRIAIASCNDMLAISYLQDGNYDLAIECNNASYDILLSLLGEHADVANNRKWRGDIFLRKGDVVAAKKYYTEALEIYTKLGFVYLADNARNTIQKCLKNNFIS
jgi:tetratricopeptide (TPR) repeat protein